jgi:1,4-alpha-glucan branching enzyme
MAKVQNRQKVKSQKVIFSIAAPKAKEVFLAGDFNNWDHKAHPMKKDSNGVWKKSVMLSPKQYEYKFLVDGDWKEDPQNDQICSNCFGTVNSVYNLS